MKLVRLLFVIIPLLLQAVLVYAATPTVGTISPSSGSTAPDIAQTFTCTYSDTDGWTNLKEGYLLINTSSTTLTNSVYLYYDQNTNLLYLRNDTDTIWLGGYAPGSSYIIENSYVKLNCASTIVSGSTATLTIKWNITFKSAYSPKTYNTYLKVVDDTGGYAGWYQKGTYTVSYPPQVGTITPSSGTGQVGVAQVFSTTYSDRDGWQNIQYVYFLMNTLISLSNCPYGYYNQNTNKLYLRNDAGTLWLGGYDPGSANIIENSYARLDCAATSVNGSGTTITVNWAIILKSTFTGIKNTYLYVKDDVDAYAYWKKVGTWTIPNNPPQVGMLTPSSGTSSPNQRVNFITTYSDPDGWLNIQYAKFLINTYADDKNCFSGYYYPISNKLYLRNDSGSAGLGGYAPGSSTIISNSYATLDCSKTTVSGSGPNLTINWSITFKDKFSSRTNNCYLSVRDNAGVWSGYIQKGTWTVLSLNPQHKIPFEAEIANLISPFIISSDLNASSGQYITIPNGSGSNYSSPGGPGVASFTFNVPLEDTYNVWARIIAPTMSDDSFFVRIDSGPAQYWLMPRDSNWLWAQVKDSTKGTFYARLAPGTHTLYFCQREDGAKLDKVIIINDPLFVPGAEDITDIAPPTGTIEINNDAEYADSTSVTLNLSATDSVSGMGQGSQMQFSNDNITWSTPEAYTITKDWTLTEGDGPKTVYVKFKDVAGNWSDAFSDSIVLGRIVPTTTNIIYTYDDLNRLKNTAIDGTSTVYTHDEVGNIANETTERNTP